MRERCVGFRCKIMGFCSSSLTNDTLGLSPSVSTPRGEATQSSFAMIVCLSSKSWAGGGGVGGDREGRAPRVTKEGLT